MLRQLTISEAVFAGVLCIFAIETAHAADPAATNRKNEYEVAIAHADADCKAAKDACVPGRAMTATCAEAGQGGLRGSPHCEPYGTN